VSCDLTTRFVEKQRQVTNGCRVELYITTSTIEVFRLDYIWINVSLHCKACSFYHRAFKIYQSLALHANMIM